ncbi:unnamed protein product [Caenorhabditis brenneri]
MVPTKFPGVLGQLTTSHTPKLREDSMKIEMDVLLLVNEQSGPNYKSRKMVLVSPDDLLVGADCLQIHRPVRVHLEDIRKLWYRVYSNWLNGGLRHEVKNHVDLCSSLSRFDGDQCLLRNNDMRLEYEQLEPYDYFDQQVNACFSLSVATRDTTVKKFEYQESPWS